MFRHCRDLLKERNDLEGRVEHTAKEKEGLVAIVAESTKVIADLQTRLKESKLFVPDL